MNNLDIALSETEQALPTELQTLARAQKLFSAPILSHSTPEQALGSFRDTQKAVHKLSTLNPYLDEQEYNAAQAEVMKKAPGIGADRQTYQQQLLSRRDPNSAFLVRGPSGFNRALYEAPYTEQQIREASTGSLMAQNSGQINPYALQSALGYTLEQQQQTHMPLGTILSSG